MPSIYLAGPITGQTYEQARWGWRRDFANRLPARIAVLSPMRQEGHLAEVKGPLLDSYPGHPFSTPRLIVAKALLDIRRVDLVVVGLQWQHNVSKNTLFEMGFADALQKPIVVVMEEGNPHDCVFVRERAMLITGSYDTAAEVVAGLLMEGV